MSGGQRPYLDAYDIARDLGQDVSTVRRWLESGYLPSLDFGHSRYVPAHLYERWKATRLRPQQSNAPRTR